MKVVALAASPRRDGNSRALAEAALAGAEAAGHDVELVHLADHVQGLLRDCRECRRADGTCSIDDGYRRLLLETVLPADALVYATPLWWYGMSGYLKSYFDRAFCSLSDEAPESEVARALLQGKRVALLISAEESYPGATLPVVQAVQEISHYLRHGLVGVVVGVGNIRGEVRLDPADPLGQAYKLGERIATARFTDYYYDTPRPDAVWDVAGHA